MFKNPKISERGKLNNIKLPKKWILVTLEDILLSLESGGRPKGGVKNIKEGVPSIGGEHLTHNGEFDFSNVRYIPKEFYENMKRGKIKRYDVLVVKDGATTGKTSFVSDSFPFKEAAVNEHVFILRTIERVSLPKYLFFWLLSPFGQNSVKENFQGTAQGGINTLFVKNYKIPLPPLAEQQRIVAKIEELFTRLDASVEALKKAKEQIRRYRQAVLKYAFEGKLTEEWRKSFELSILNDELKQNSPLKTQHSTFTTKNYEPATVLLERIKEERKKKLGKKYRELPPIDTSELPELPKGWVWVRLREIANDINPGFPSGKHNKDNMGIPHLRPMNINFKGKIDLSNIKYIQPEKEFDKLIRGDILFNNTNSPELLGKTCYIKENTNWAYSNHMTRIRVNGSFVNPAWVSYCLHTLFLNGFFKLNCTHHVNQASINTTFLSERVYIPFPPLAEQQQIVEEIERRFSVVDEVEKAIDNNLKQAERLRQSILKRAFEGKLVPQDPNDEPAERLVERILNDKC